MDFKAAPPASRRDPRRSALLLLALGLAIGLAPATRRAGAEAGDTAGRDDAALAERVKVALRQARLGDRLGISIRDLRTGREVVAHNAKTPLKPASNLKLLTAAACLLELGAEFRIPTGLYAELKRNSVVSALYLKGYGDPTLRSQDLAALAVQLAARGVKRVEQIVVDGSQFDDQELPPGFEEQPHEFSAFRAAVAAVSVDENAYSVQVRPGAQLGSAAEISLAPKGHFTVNNQVTTAASGALRLVMDQKQDGDRLALSLSGSVPLRMGSVDYRRRVEAPLLYAGAVMADGLRAAGIQVGDAIRLARTPPGLPLLVVRQSPPLAQMLSMVGKYSDNFVAEMLLKVLAAERGQRPATSPGGATIALARLARLGLPSADIRMVNGSGLFGDSRITAAYFTGLLAAMHGDPSVRAEFMAQLAVGGVDGTLAQRLTTLPTARIIRAKTGTLDDVIALSGYVLGPTPERVIAFSLLLNGVRGKQAAARALADEIVRQIAGWLWRPQAPPSPSP